VSHPWLKGIDFSAKNNANCLWGSSLESLRIFISGISVPGYGSNLLLVVVVLFCESVGDVFLFFLYAGFTFVFFRATLILFIKKKVDSFGFWWLVSSMAMKTVIKRVRNLLVSLGVVGYVYAGPGAYDKTIEDVAALGAVVREFSDSPERTVALSPAVGVLVCLTDQATGSWPRIHYALRQSWFLDFWDCVDHIRGQRFPEFTRKLDFRVWGAWIYYYSPLGYFPAWIGVLMHHIVLLAFQGRAEWLALELLQMAGNVAFEQYGGVVPDPLAVPAMSVLVGEDLAGRLGGDYKAFLTVGAFREDIKASIESRRSLAGMERAARMIWGLDLLLGAMSVYLHTFALYHLFIWGTDGEVEAEYMGVLRGIKTFVAILREVGVLRTA
jgi:hypothetical protein